MTTPRTNTIGETLSKHDEHEDCPPVGSATPAVDDLQRELLAICKGRDNYETWAKVTGQPINARINEMRRLGNHGAVLALRKQIHALNPNAALYFGWCPGEDRHHARDEFFAAIARTTGANQ